MSVTDDDSAVDEFAEHIEPLTPTGRSACPYLGLSFDKTTWFAFPSPGNCCHYVNKPGEIDMRHQQGYCLTANYPSCALLQMDSPKNLPRGIAGSLTGGPRRSRWWLVLLALLLLAATIAALLAFPETRERLLAAGFADEPPVGVYEAMPDEAEPDSGAAAAVPVVAATDTPAPTATVSATETAAPTATIPPAETAAPTATLTPEPSPEDTATPAVTATPQLPQALVTVELLNVRAGPGDDFPVVAQFEQNRQLTVTGRDANGIWLRVCCLDDGGEGWVFALSVTVTGNVAAVPVVEEETP